MKPNPFLIKRGKDRAKEELKTIFTQERNEHLEEIRKLQQEREAEQAAIKRGDHLLSDS